VDYEFSVISSETHADFVMNPAFEREANLEFLRGHLQMVLTRQDNTGEPSPSTAEGWAEAATRNLGMYHNYEFIIEFDTKTSPFVSFDKLMEYEKTIIEEWMTEDLDPIYPDSEDFPHSKKED